MATFPKRLHVLEDVLGRIAPQLDRLHLILNEYVEPPGFLKSFGNLSSVLPAEDLKDVGKFAVREIDPADHVFLLDDDIKYPDGYVRDLNRMFQGLPFERKVVGVHGVIYSDFFDGSNTARCVYPFFLDNDRFRLVNQLGTGTVMCLGRDLPPFERMRGSERFVDVRFAVHQHQAGVPLVCVPRQAKWLQQVDLGDEKGVFETFTLDWPLAVLREARLVAGYGKLDADKVAALVEWQTEDDA
jgi:hypothetical protein